MLRQSPAALKLYDRVLDITPNDPDMMVLKADIYQTQGNLEEAAKFLEREKREVKIPELKLTQLRLERNHGETLFDWCKTNWLDPIMILSSTRPVFRRGLLSCSALLAIQLVQRLQLNRRAYIGAVPRRSTRQPILGPLSSLCRNRAEGFGSEDSGACSLALSPC